MGRTLRIDIAGLTYHVIARGNYRQDIFHTEADKERYTELLAHCRKEYAFSFYAFVLMDNHVHLLLERPAQTSLGEIIKALHGRFAKETNMIRKRVGHLFQGRFYAVIIEEDAYLLELTRYIHLNLVRAGMVMHARTSTGSAAPAPTSASTITPLSLSGHGFPTKL